MPLILSALLAIAITTGPLPVLDAGDDALGPTLTLPGGPTIQMPPGVEVFGPHGLDHDLGPEAPAVPRAKPEPPAAAELPPAQSSAERRKSRIDELCKRLGQAKDETEATAIIAMLDRLWLQSGSDTADLMMARALSAIGSEDYKTAQAVLDKVVALDPDWAEAWNKRATVHFLQDDDSDSMVDISHVLALEPRHFGALSGMGFILHREGDDKAALTVLRRAAAVNPQDAGVNTLIEQLTPEVEGHDI